MISTRIERVLAVKMSEPYFFAPPGDEKSGAYDEIKLICDLCGVSRRRVSEYNIAAFHASCPGEPTERASQLLSRKLRFVGFDYKCVRS